MAEKLLPGKENEEKRRIVKLSALLHDVGHGPFSHVSEDLLDRYSGTTPADKKEKIHEKITAALIESNPELGALLSTDDKKNIIGLLSGTQVDISLMKEIVSGPLDADKMDYLLRDSYFCGVKYGVFDLHRMLNIIGSYEEDYDKYMAISYDGINSLEQFVLAKYYMTTQVYRHKVRLVSDAMIIRGLELGIEKDEIDFLKRLYRYEDTEEYIDNYLNYWDDKVINELVFSEKSGFAPEFFKRLYNRQLFKRVFSEKLKDIEIIDEKTKDRIINITSKENEGLRKEIEKKIASLRPLQCKKEEVIVNSFTIKSVKEMSRNSEGEIIVIDQKGGKRNFEEESTVFSSINESMKDMFFEVYAPLEYIDYKDKNKKLEELRKSILKILKSIKEGEE